jgi:thiosulfate dehydrogenase [quinone] large subunit
MKTNTAAAIPEPPFARFLFGDSRIALVWAVIRVYVGWEWLMAGWEKIHSAAWVGTGSGSALQGFLMGALQKTAGEHPSVSNWYAWFIEHIALQHTVFFSHLVAWGEVAVGIGLILGIFTGIAAFFGAFMNLNYLFAGTVSTNPFLLLLQLFLILAWRNAGWLGIDRWLLPKLGVPWHRR